MCWQTLRHQRKWWLLLILVQRRALILVKNKPYIRLHLHLFSLLGQQRSLVIRGAIIQMESTSLNPFDSKNLSCCWISTSIHCLLSVSVSGVWMCLPVVSIFPLSQMSDTRAASWQRMQMMPLTLWSLPPAEAFYQHSALPGSGCKCCPFWRAQKFSLLPDCGSLHFSGQCCVVTL